LGKRGKGIKRNTYEAACFGAVQTAGLPDKNPLTKPAKKQKIITMNINPANTALFSDFIKEKP
jgi:hypothetical protein